MFRSLLIANRGEIACRVIRTCHRFGIRTIAVHSDADADALHVEMADEAHAIGGAAASESYLVQDRILEAARASGAEAIHPGYGFLSENADFAEACQTAGIVFVGPPASAIRAMGLKDEAKALMERNGVPVVPGFHGARQETDFLREKAYEIGYPVIIKAVAGGGGKGMRRVDKQIAFDDALQSAKREAKSAFGDDRVLVEKFVERPRHIEIQVFGDSHGGAAHLHERDCSLQRRHQKVIEEAPAPGMTEGLRRKMGEAGVRAAKAVDYVGAGTVEFIVDGGKPLNDDTAFYFMEMNTRLQVEHPVTEDVTGLDLVEWQLRVAAGEPLPLSQDEIPLDGHAVEARLYAEDPDNGFLPSPGRIHALVLPEDDRVRIDTGVRAGDVVTPFYDPMIAKVIVFARSRDDALDGLADALDETIVAGPRTNVGFLAALARHDAFRESSFDTRFIDTHMAELWPEAGPEREAQIALGALSLLDPDNEDDGSGSLSPWDVADGFVLGTRPDIGFDVTVDGEPQTLKVGWTEEGPGIRIGAAGTDAVDIDADIIETEAGVFVLQGGRQVLVARADPAAATSEAAAGDTIVRAPMHGKVVGLFVAEGDAVAAGQKLAVVEAMKMEHTLAAPRDGTVSDVQAGEGDQVAEGQTLLIVHAEE